MTEAPRSGKCVPCVYGFHDECARPGRTIDLGHGLISPAPCCCSELGFYFDADGIEHWPNGTIYEPPEVSQ